MTTVEEIAGSIISGNFTNEQLSAIANAVTYARGQLARVNKQQFRVGSSVQFLSSRYNRKIQGTVKKVAIKYITVDTGFTGQWRVPAAMLEAV